MMQQTFGDPRERLPLLRERAVATIRDAIARYKPRAVRILMSGGKDSLTVAHLTADAAPGTTVLHIDTGTGARQTRDFVVKACHAQGWNLEIRATPPSEFEAICREHGLPGPAQHQKAYIRLKERRIEDLKRDTAHLGPRRPVLLITGVRKHESKKRMGYVEPVVKRKGVVWVAPAHDWTGTDVLNFLEARAQELNPVSKMLGISGECFCGSNAARGEAELIRIFLPDVWVNIQRWQQIAAEAGKPCVWGKRPKGHRRRGLPKLKKRAKRAKGERGLGAFDMLCGGNCSTRTVNA